MRAGLLPLSLLGFVWGLTGVLGLARQTPQASILDFPSIQADLLTIQGRAVELVKAKRFDEAEVLLEEMTRNYPDSPSAHYNLACLRSIRGKVESAFESLERSVQLGFRKMDHLKKDPDLIPLRKDKRFGEVLSKAKKPYRGSVWLKFPNPIRAVAKDGQVVLDEANLGFDPKVGLFVGLIGRGKGGAEIAKGQGEVGDMLRNWYGEGTASGNFGDFYDNHDGDHSNMDFRGFPQITRIEYAEPLRKRALHNGLQRRFVFSGITIGNSSTAITGGINWRSQPRLAMTQPYGANILSLHYLRNHLYFYPEHKDHDPGHNGKGGGHGDVFAANVPYLVISQGSSGSDRPFLNAFAAMLAALRPETKSVLARTALLMPTLQQIFRRSNGNLQSAEDYFTGKAHPTVFDASNLIPATMVRRAHDLLPESLPPLGQFRVVREDMPVSGRDFFDYRPDQRLFDTPCAVARVYKSSAGSLRFTLDAGSSRDLSGKPLVYRWEILRGDPKGIAIEKKDDNGSLVEVTIAWHPRRPIQPGSPMESNRADIGLFVGNGDHWSAPAFFSIYFPDNQERIYDDEGRILSIDYGLDNYVDPLIESRRDWRDEYRYDAKRNCIGWTRFHKGDKKGREFTRNGLMIKDDEDGRTEEITVRYLPRKLSDGRVILVQQPR